MIMRGLLQARTRRSKRSTGRREPVVHAILAYVAIQETAAKDIIRAATPGQSGKRRKAANLERALRNPFTQEKAAKLHVVEFSHR